jgi:hypothetical protein
VSSSCFFRFYNICLKCIIQMFIFIGLDLFISYHVNMLLYLLWILTLASTVCFEAIIWLMSGTFMFIKLSRI